MPTDPMEKTYSKAETQGELHFRLWFLNLVETVLWIKPNPSTEQSESLKTYDKDCTPIYAGPASYIGPQLGIYWR